jgi:hypothetical protein
MSQALMVWFLVCVLAIEQFILAKFCILFLVFIGKLIDFEF